MRVLVTGAAGNAGQATCRPLVDQGYDVRRAGVVASNAASLKAAEKLDWTPKIGFAKFLRDLSQRDANGEDVRGLWAPGQLPNL